MVDSLSQSFGKNIICEQVHPADYGRIVERSNSDPAVLVSVAEDDLPLVTLLVAIVDEQRK